MYQPFFKRLLDLFFAFIAIIIFSPIIFLLSIILFFNNGGSPFFFQKRPGRKGRIFRVVKFRTMTNKRDVNGELLSDSLRLTSLGKLLRKTSLDELPQLFNVLIGNMSFIGPRPLLPEYLPLYNLRQQKRHELKPGITGWAQVNGRNNITWSKKFEYDIWYIENISFILDIKILLMTFLKVIKTEGINSENSVTTEKFTGNN